MKHLFVLLLAFWIPMGDLPEVNQKIVAYCQAQVGKKIDRGECWDLAKAALDQAGAVWEPPYHYGTPYDYKKDTILPGDIIQFENVELKGELYKVTMPHHTAIVMSVTGPLQVTVAHQNFAGKRTVQLTELNFGDLKKGTVQFFHPTK